MLAGFTGIVPARPRCVNEAPSAVAFKPAEGVVACARGRGPVRLLVTALSGLSAIMVAVNTSELALPDDYPHLLAQLKAQIRSAQRTATRTVNTALIELYWNIGKANLDRQSAEGLGDPGRRPALR